MSAYYNENDPFAAAWLRALIARGLIAPGDVDERSIKEVNPDDLRGYDQCHFFAGIGGWSRALRLAKWPDDRPVWTGSCPCQPFSAAGKRKGTDDERHLWPEFHRLIADGRPAVVFGEQVASKDGRAWLAGIRADLEALGYGVGAADLCAAGVGAPHIRQRLWWLADANSSRECGRFDRERSTAPEGESEVGRQDGERLRPFTGRNRTNGRLAESNRIAGGQRCALGAESDCGSDAEQGAGPWGGGGARGMGNADDEGSQGRDGRRDGAGERTARASGVGFWSNFDLIPCADGKARRVESGTFPLAHGVSNRVGLLRGYGNAIVPQVAAQFIESVEEARLRAFVFGD